MNNILLEQQILVSVVAAAAGVAYFVSALGARRCGESSAAARFGVAAFVFVIAILVALRELAPVVAYSITCFSLVVVFLADLVRDERARRRRVALLTPRPAVDRVPAVWVAITLLSTLTLVPYVLGGIDVVPALIEGACVLAMAAIAWRIASAPTQLTSEHPQSEDIRDRAHRARVAGLTCVLAIGSIALFLSFMNARPPAVGGLGRVTDIDMFVLWAALWTWQAWYVRRVSQAACAVSH